MSDLISYKLTTGEQIIGSVEKFDDVNSTMMLSNVVSLRFKQNGPTTYEVGFVPFDHANPDGNIMLFLHACVAACSITPDLEKAYLQQTSGIQIASSIIGA